VLRLDEPGDGIAVIGTFQMGDQARGVASIFFYGGEPPDIAAAEQTKWTTWLSDVLQRVPDRV
jgi:hypothetical protein